MTGGGVINNEKKDQIECDTTTFLVFDSIAAYHMTQDLTAEGFKLKS